MNNFIDFSIVKPLLMYLPEHGRPHFCYFPSCYDYCYHLPSIFNFASLLIYRLPCLIGSPLLIFSLPLPPLGLLRAQHFLGGWVFLLSFKKYEQNHMLQLLTFSCDSICQFLRKHFCQILSHSVSCFFPQTILPLALPHSLLL